MRPHRGPPPDWIEFHEPPAWLLRWRRWKTYCLQSIWLRCGAALAASVLIHLAVMGMVQWRWPQWMTATRGISEDVSLGEVRLAPLPEETVLRSEATAATASPVPAPLPPQTRFDEAPLAMVDGAAPQSPAAASPAPPQTPPGSLAGEQLGTATFLGASALGVRFCIVADRSGSMRGRKLEYVKEQIVRTVASMQPDMRFHVVLFGADAQSFSNRRWSHPRDDLPELQRWLQTIQAEGDTQPTLAFSRALGLFPEPDAIFFLTDGDFPEDVADQVARLNRSNVAIQTIAFLDRAGEAQLQRIARDSGGEYRFLSEY